MSNKCSAIAWERDFGSMPRKLIATRLADFADDKGRGIWPSVERLAAECNMSDRTVQRTLADFVEEGLLIIVSEGGNGPGNTRRYDYDMAALEGLPEATWGARRPAKKGDTVSPFGEAKGDTVSAKGDSHDEKGCQGVTQTTIEPPKELSDARERANESPEEKILEDRPGTAAFQKRVQCLIHGVGYSEEEWPNWDSSSPGWIERMFAKLTLEERKEAEAGRDPLLAKARRNGKNPMPIGVYLRDKAWTLLSEADRKWSKELAARKEGGKAAAKPEGWAPAYGPAHASELFRILLAGPQNPNAAPQNGIWLSNHIRTAWPRLFAFRQSTAIHGGLVLTGRDADLMEFVPAGSDLMADWQAELKRRGWPDMPVLDGMRGLYFPRGGIEGLDEFRRRVEGERNAAAE